MEEFKDPGKSPEGIGYCYLDECDKKHMKKLLLWLFEESRSAGGDGDGLWYSQNYNVKDILPVVQEVNAELGNPWKVHYSEEGKTIFWNGPPEEWIEITNDRLKWHDAPDWQQVMVRW